MTTDPTAGEGPTPSGDPEPSAPQTSFEEQPPPSQQPAAPQPRPAGSGFFDSIRRTGLYRADRRWVGGVASGVAARLGWDPLLVRGLFVITFFLGGIGFVAYGLGWALLPEQSDGRIHLEQAIRGTFDVALLGAAILFLFGFAWGGPWDWWNIDGGWLAALFWLVVIVGIVYLLIQAARRRPSTEGAPHAQPYPGPQPSAGRPYPYQQAPYQQAPGTPSGGAPDATGGPPAANGVVGLEENPPTATSPAPSAPPSPYPGPAAPSAGAPYAGVPYGGAPYGRPVPPQQVPPRPPRRKGGGAGIVLGLILLTGALLLLDGLVLGSTLPYLAVGQETGMWAAWVGISLLIIGVAIVVAGLRGRSSGALGAMAIVWLVLGVPTLGVLQADVPARFDDGRAIVDDVLDFDGRVDGREPGAPISEGTFSPNQVEEAERGYAVSWGEPTIDLTELDLPEAAAGDPIEVPIAVGAGAATVVVPQDAAVEVDGLLSAGGLEWFMDGDERTYGGVNDQRVEIASDEVGEDGPQLRLLVEIAAGELVIEEEQ